MHPKVRIATSLQCGFNKLPCHTYDHCLFYVPVTQERSGKEPHIKTDFAHFFFFSLHHLIYTLTARVVGAPQMISQPVSSIFPCSPLPSGTWLLQACPFPDVVFPPLPLSPLSSSPPFTVSWKIVLARPGEQETWPYYCSLRLSTMVRRSLCGLFASWILAMSFFSLDGIKNISQCTWCWCL